MTDMADLYVTEARGLLTAVLDSPGWISAQASLDVVQALCELAPDGALPAYPSTPACEDGPAAALRAARSLLRLAIPYEDDVVAVLRLAAAVGCLDAATRAVTP